MTLALVAALVASATLGGVALPTETVEVTTPAMHAVSGSNGAPMCDVDATRTTVLHLGVDERIAAPHQAAHESLPMTEVFEAFDDFERIERVMVLLAMASSPPVWVELVAPLESEATTPRDRSLDTVRSLRGPPAAV